MSKEPFILAVLRISILDTPIKGVIYIVDFNDKKASLCYCRGLQSPIFQADDETEAYHKSRDWFMNNYDGFVQVSRLEGQEEIEEKKRFNDFRDAFSV